MVVVLASLETEINVLRVVVVEGCKSFFLVPAPGWVVGEGAAGVSAVYGEGLVALFLGLKFFGTGKGAKERAVRRR